jgi:anthranilate/para-aminobenzoate synthase component I
MRDAPAAAVHTWPPDRPLAIVCERSRTLLVEPIRTIRFDSPALAGEWLSPITGAVVGALSAAAEDPLASFDALLASAAPEPAGGWIGYLSYDLGRIIEPSIESSALARPHAAADRTWPLAVFHRYRTIAEFERPFEHAQHRGWTLGDLKSQPPRDYTSAVARALAYIRAGDIFQVNLAHRISAPFRGDPRAAFTALAAQAHPWHGAYLELPPHKGERAALLSISPELFLEFDLRARTILTRPMKGTRPADASPDELYRSEKDRAELNMIIDLMRNDLGRVAELASVRVTAERTIERHSSGVLQATGAVAARLREGVRFSEILRAAFPPGSVTGTPKIRAMQIIDELEPVRRGPYCGAIAHIPDHGPARMSVAIRTACIQGRADSPASFATARLDYSVGAGIVAESDPESEWRETLLKASILGALTGTDRPREPIPSMPVNAPAGPHRHR